MSGLAREERFYGKRRTAASSYNSARRRTGALFRPQCVPETPQVLRLKKKQETEGSSAFRSLVRRAKLQCLGRSKTTEDRG